MSFSTEGLARACAVHPKRTLAVWLAALLVSFVVIALLLGNALTSEGDITSNPESRQAEELIRESFPPQPTPSEIVVVRSDRYTVDDPAFRAKVQSLGERGEELGVVAEAQNYYASSDPSLVSQDRHATIVLLVMHSDEIAPSCRPCEVGGRTGRLSGCNHRLPDGRRRLREALRRRFAEGRAARSGCRPR